MDDKEISVQIGEKAYRARATMLMALHFERQSGQSYLSVFNGQREASLTEMTTLVWAAIKAGGDAMTIEEFADKLDAKTLGEVFTRIASLINKNTSAGGGNPPPLA
jgi:hypothetical protein